PYRQGPGAFAGFPFILQRDLQAIWRNPVELNDRIPVLHAAWLVVSQHEGADGQLGLLPPAEPVTDKGVTVGLSGVYGLQNLGPALLAVILFCGDFHDGFQLLHVSIPPVFSRRSSPRRSVPTPRRVEAAAVAGRGRRSFLPPFALFHTPATDDLRHTPVLRTVPKSPQVIPKLNVEPHACKIVLSLSDREYLETERPRPIDHLPIVRTQALLHTTADTMLKTPRSVGLSSEVEKRL